MKRRACGPKWKKTLYWIIWNRFEDNWLYAFGIRALSNEHANFNLRCWRRRRRRRK